MPLKIAPEAAALLGRLDGDLKRKVKNALREINRNERLSGLVGEIGAYRLYKAGRFRILYRRRNGSVWIDAVALEPRTSWSAQKEHVP